MVNVFYNFLIKKNKSPKYLVEIILSFVFTHYKVFSLRNVLLYFYTIKKLKRYYFHNLNLTV